MKEIFHPPDYDPIHVRRMTRYADRDAQQIVGFLFPNADLDDDSVSTRLTKNLGRLEIKGHRFYGATVHSLYARPLLSGILQTSTKFIGLRMSIPNISKIGQMRVMNMKSTITRTAIPPDLDVQAALLYSASRDFSSTGRMSIAASIESQIGVIDADELALTAAGLRAALLEQRPWLAQSHLVEV